MRASPGGAEGRGKAGWAEMLLQHEGGDGLLHGHLDRGALAGARAAEQGGHDGAGGDLAGDVVAHHQRDVARGAVAADEQAGDAADRLDHRVVGGAAAVGTARAEAGDRAVDQARAGGAGGGGVEAEAGQRLGADVGYQHVAAVQDAQHRGARRRLLQVQADRALVAVEGEVPAGVLAAGRGAAEGAEHVALGRFQFYHVGAVVGQAEGAGRPDDHGGQVEDADAREGYGRWFGVHWCCPSRPTWHHSGLLGGWGGVKTQRPRRS